MRDLFLLLAFPIFIYYVVRTPIVGLYLWFWSSMYPMSNWAYGFAQSLRFNLVFSILTILGYFFALKDKPKFKLVGLFVFVVLFYLHSSIGLIIHGQSDYQWRLFSDFSKVMVFFIFCILMLRKEEHFQGMLFFLSLALGFYGLVEALKFIVTAGAHNIYGIKGPLGDNNKVALGLNMITPLILFMASQMKSFRLKQFFWVIAAGCIMSVFATGSRGGFLALAFMGAYYWWTTGKNVGIFLTIILVMVLAFNFLPAEWFERMETIKDSGSSEGGLVSRITSWKINLLAALDYPITGIGFNATAFANVWPLYAHDLDSINFFVYTPYPTQGYVAHSIYFEVLGNQGFVGLFLFLGILISAHLNINSMIKKHYVKSSWESQLLKATKVSLYTFMVGGAALSAAYFEMFYLLLSFVICLKIKALVQIESDHNLNQPA